MLISTYQIPWKDSDLVGGARDCLWWRALQPNEYEILYEAIATLHPTTGIFNFWCLVSWQEAGLVRSALHEG